MTSTRRPGKEGGAGAARVAIRLCFEASPRLLVLVMLLSTAVSTLPAALLLIVREIVEAFSQGDDGRATTWILVLGGLTAARVALAALLSVRREELTELVGITAEQRLLRVTGFAPLERFDDPAWYDAVARAHDGVTWRPAAIAGILIEFCGQIVSLAGMVGVLAVLDFRLIGLALLAGVPLLVQRRLEARAIYLARRGTTELERRRDYLTELLVRYDLAKDVRSYGLAAPFTRMHDDISRRALRAVVAASRHSVARGLVAGVLSAVCLVVAYYLAAGQAQSGALTVAELFLVFTAFNTLVSSTVDLFTIAVDIEEHAAYLTDFVALAYGPARPADPPSEAAPVVVEHVPEVEFQGVGYAYAGGSPVLREVSFTLRPGEFTVLVGRNGAGKSTLVKLLLGLLGPVNGRILVDGADLAGLDPARLRELIGVLYQEYGRYEFTVAESVRLGRADRPLDHERLDFALRAGGLDGLVARLPQGADNLVGRMFPGARDLSGGQWQRLALARVLYRDAPVWVLDEPTAALDVQAEAALIQRLRAERGRRTVLLITHRLETAQTADRVLVLDDGVLVEHGSHEELISRGGSYARLCAEYAARSG
ncbi:ABC transporter ATP-binding protein [Nonomuraea endophytica]|uniref:ABC-type multidrug transport system fused ATPase/permease subunit n=1 Tax=Nonomuraea endophytica TaxID=714136 RepID=A0A7W8EDD7_9ACTN|nr:ABC transporter ATP-binding protein [Nonomuraea endophytica]MBB5076450.1 ABC-type multidrug transport system fused ATPase/permease subunit [Nonomuraea endophytica]